MLFFQGQLHFYWFDLIDPIVGWLWLARTARARVELLLYILQFCIHLYLRIRLIVHVRHTCRYNWESHISNINAQVHRCIIFSPNGQFNHIENAQYRIQYYYIINTQPHGSSSTPFPSAIWSKSKIVILSHTQNSLPLTAERVLLPVSPKLLTALQATTSLDRANVSCILSDNVRHCCSPIVAYSVATFPRVTLGFGIFKPTKPENVS